MDKKILLGHGSGGEMSHKLIKDIFVKHFNNEVLSAQTDSALLEFTGEMLSFTTDSYVVDPIFFPGGNIGKLAVCGTVNDLAVSGATPLYLSSSFIIEEGFLLSDLEIIVETMAAEAKKAGVKIVTGDTKVVGRGKCDKVFINTSGIGVLKKENIEISSGLNIKTGDKIIVNGTIGDHGMTIMGTRNELNFTSNLKSDCAPLNHLIKEIKDSIGGIKFMRDATRGGVATVLCELAENNNIGIELDESKIPLLEEVAGMCEVFGFDPLHVANEGKLIMVVDGQKAESIISKMQTLEYGQNAQIIGDIVFEHKGTVLMHTEIGGKRIVDMLSGEQLPRIC